MKVIYGRISTLEQNEERQLHKGLKTFIDKCNGDIAFFERPLAKKLFDFLKLNPQTETQIQSVDRLGRSTIDILNTCKVFKDMNYLLRIEDLGMDNNSPFFDLMISILGTLAQHEKKNIRERSLQGILIAKAHGKYIGRLKNTKEDRNKVLKKHNDIVVCLKSKMKISEIAKLTKKNRNTIYKVKNIL